MVGTNSLVRWSAIKEVNVFVNELIRYLSFYYSSNFLFYDQVRFRYIFIKNGAILTI